MYLPAQHRFHPSQQFHQFKGLGDVVSVAMMEKKIGDIADQKEVCFVVIAGPSVRGRGRAPRAPTD